MAIQIGPGVTISAGINVTTNPPQGLFVSGSGSTGQLGLGTTVGRSSPVQVGPSDIWNLATLVSSPNYWNMIASNTTSNPAATLAIDGLNALWAWGGTISAGTFGSLGQGDTLNRSSPTQVGALTTWPTVGNKLAISLQANWAASLVIRSTTDSS